MESFAQPCPPSFDELYRAYAPLARATALRIVRNANDAEDVVQMVFLRVWLTSAHFPSEHLESRIVLLAKHRALDFLRARRREVARAKAIANDVVIADVEVLALQRSAAQSVWKAVALLPSAQRDVVFESFYGGISHRRIAQNRALPLGTVKSRIRSGLTTLRRHVDLDSRD